MTLIMARARLFPRTPTTKGAVMSLKTSYLLGRTGLRVSPLTLGTMTFGQSSGWGADRATAQAIFDCYVEAGGYVFDTADLYTGGNSETWLGEFIAERGLRDRAVITSKFSYNAETGNPNAGGNGRKNILRAVEGSLRRLKTDYLDLYLLHSWDRLTPVEEVVRTFDDLVRSGKVRHVGLSDIPAWYAAHAITTAQLRGYEPISALQLEYSLVERAIEQEFCDLAVTLGAGLMAWSPLGSGLLSGKYRAADLDRDLGRLSRTRQSAIPTFHKFSTANFRVVEVLEQVAADLGRSMAQVAINWVAGQPGVATTIIGATRIEQIEDNLTALDFEIPPELRARLDEAGRPATPFPYSFFTPAFLAAQTGGVPVGDKPARYAPPIRVGIA
jgi:aryl-alcohol dehydrogenase-like predicted oxidoreductase